MVRSGSARAGGGCSSMSTCGRAPPGDAWGLAEWARRLSWTAVAEAFDTTWDHVFRAVAITVQWGLAHRDLTGV